MPRLAMKFSSSFSLVSMGSLRSSTQQLRAEKGNGADRGGDKASVIGDGGEGMYIMISSLIVVQVSLLTTVI